MTATPKETLHKLYTVEKHSVPEIAKILKQSEHKVNYWIQQYQISKRTISEAIYLKNNPKGDPFTIHNPQNYYEAELRGLGLGLYWGEGAKKNKYSVKLGNTDPYLIKKFLEFLRVICGIKPSKLRFSLQVFNDSNPQTALNFWIKNLKISSKQFTKTTITPSRGPGTYKHKNKTGVLNVHFHNKKLRDILCQMVETAH